MAHTFTPWMVREHENSQTSTCQSQQIFAERQQCANRNVVTAGNPLTYLLRIKVTGKLIHHHANGRDIQALGASMDAFRAVAWELDEWCRRLSPGLIPASEKREAS